MKRIARSGWMIYLLIVILGLICNYVRGIGLFPITGYCSNTTSCTENHCELKSNKVCHCYRGKLCFFLFFFQVHILTFPGMLPEWIKCTVMCLCLIGNIWNTTRHMWLRIAECNIVLFLICTTQGITARWVNKAAFCPQKSARRLKAKDAHTQIKVIN